MAPIHHHFEMKAWSETKIMVRFWIVGAILCAIGFVLYYRYYLRLPARDDRAARSCSGSRARDGRRRARSARAGSTSSRTTPRPASTSSAAAALGADVRLGD